MIRTIKTGERRPRARAVDESNGRGGRGGEERQGKGEPACDVVDDDVHHEGGQGKSGQLDILTIFLKLFKMVCFYQ